MMPQIKFPSLLLLFFSLNVLAQNEGITTFPNFEFPDGKKLKYFTDIGVVLVYGESNCPACQRAQVHLQIRYKRWKSWGFPVVYIALDSDKKQLKQNFGHPPWPIYCDEKSWDSPWVVQANIDFTPTLFALDQNLNQYYQAENVAQMDLWLIDNFSDPN
jgi:glutaredoxin